MRRFCLVMLAMLSLALLPGPAHALMHAHNALAHAHHALTHAYSADHAQSGPHHHDHLAATPVPDHHHGGPGHHHGAVCDTACCAPACSVYAPPATAAIRVGHAEAQPLPTSDRPRPDADERPSLRPPEAA